MIKTLAASAWFVFSRLPSAYGKTDNAAGGASIGGVGDLEDRNIVEIFEDSITGIRKLLEPVGRSSVVAIFVFQTGLEKLVTFIDFPTEFLS